jgi:probable F420-dependent oxidoreductase
MSKEIRFGFTLASPASKADLVDTVRSAEGYGYDIAVTVDHLGTGRTSPFQGALAAAMISDTMRVGTFVLNSGYWNPTMLAREVATIQRLTGGRFELGMGTGIIKAMYDAAGIPWQPYLKRLAWLETSAAKVRELLAAESGVDMPRLMLGGASTRTVKLAAEHADIVSLAGIVQIPGRPPGALRVLSGDETRKLVAEYRSFAGARVETLEFNAFVQDVVVTEDRQAAAEAIADEQEGMLSVEGALDSPFLLIGTEEEIAAQVVGHHKEYGFTSFYVQRPWMEKLGPVIKRVRALVG